MIDLISMDKRDIIKAFRDYQKEWLYSHHDFELSSRLEEVIAEFLDNTAERFMVEKSHLLEERATIFLNNGDVIVCYPNQERGEEKCTP